MKKIIALLSAFVLTMAVFTACGSSASSSSAVVSSAVETSEILSSQVVSSQAATSVEGKVSEKSTKSTSEFVNSTTAPSEELSDDIRSGNIQLDGVVYTFPVESYQTFLDNGWTSEKPFDYSIPSATMSQNHTMKNAAGNMFQISIANATGETKNVEDCPVTDLFISNSSIRFGNGLDVVLPGGITIDSTYDEVIAAYGQPDDKSEGSNYLNIKYQTKSTKYNYVQIDFDKENETVGKIDYINYTFIY